MNESGKAVLSAYRKVGGPAWGKLCVVHDDLEVPLGGFKVRRRGMGRYLPHGSSGVDGRGHNGIASCLERLKTEVPCPDYTSLQPVLMGRNS
jgi:peptidyl-tRNA hydrolase